MIIKKKIIITAAIAVVVLAAGIAGGVLIKRHIDRENAVAADVEEIISLVTALYVSPEKENIAEDLTVATIEEIALRMVAREEEGLIGRVEEDFAAAKDGLETARKMLQTRTDVLALLNADGALTESADITSVKTELEKWKKTKPIFYEQMMKMVAEAESQEEEIDAARETVTTLFSDYSKKTVKEDVAVAEVAAAKEKADGIKQAATKKALLSEIALAEEFIQEREEAAAAAAAAQAAKPSGGGSSGGGSTTASSTYAQALAVAQGIANSIGPGTDLERITAAALAVSSYYYQGVHKESGPYYSTAYGVFIAKESSCAGCTRALGMVLTCMGYQWEHVNENQWAHQWCRVVMDGQVGFADGQVGWAGYGQHPVE